MEARYLREHALGKGSLRHFKTIKPLGAQIIVDTYFDKANRLSGKGIWIRHRECLADGGSSKSKDEHQWEAKVRIGGDFTESEFEEVAGQAEPTTNELVKTVESSSEEGLLEVKRMAAARMDQKIREFMERYYWAFSADKPVGKLSAFFALKRSRKA
ncbi:hypothetical protein H2199_001932 [Coniosporium tulheliwenetii]|uniref:Uncharacterized protein n=1 Tax=Coniosporium tulheliwenetii TaxID=3383036 RepID=A0ACC2ZKR8_9PEZI|nr:hypothetical protein H2199_001932 [Cladosporium sp. JES 115]